MDEVAFVSAGRAEAAAEFIPAGMATGGRMGAGCDDDPIEAGWHACTLDIEPKGIAVENAEEGSGGKRLWFPVVDDAPTVVGIDSVPPSCHVSLPVDLLP